MTTPGETTTEWAPIETKHRGYTFRSRLEATWAAFFEMLGWVWEPEPLDLDGYIPDFALMFPKAPILVEVKPELTLAGLEQYRARLESSGWEGEFLLVGATPLFSSTAWKGTGVMGLLAQYMDPPDEGWAYWGAATETSRHAWGQAEFVWCDKEHWGFSHETQSFFCRYCGWYAGGCLPGAAVEPESEEWTVIGNMWRLARSETRWLPHERSAGLR